MQRCPTADRWTDLLAGSASDTDRETLETHLGDCADCQQTLQDLSEESPAWQHWRRLLRGDSAPTKRVLHDPPTAFLERLAQTLAPPARRPGSSRLPWPEIPGYEILGELGRGGTAVVYRARQISLNRIVALKTILAGLSAESERRARFRAEAEAVARLQHPNIVQIHEVGEANGLPYLALEYVDGGSLASGRPGTWSPRPAAELVAVLARAVHFAHQHGIVHRDLKPANVLLQVAASGLRIEKPAIDSSQSAIRNPQSAIPKIADFGLARMHTSADSTRLTQTGAILGTPRYMSPEQARPRSVTGQEVGPAADIYALGAMLYEMLSGRPPFEAETTVQTLLQIIEEEPLPLRRLQPQVPRDLETITLKCLEKDPGRRYASAGELALDLDRFRAGEPIKARPIGELERFWKWAKRRPAVVAAMAATILGLVGVTLALLQTRAAQRQALSSLDNSERSVYFGDIAQARSQWLLNNVQGAEQLLDRCVDKRRGWEWRHLKGLNHVDLLTIADTGGPFVNGLAYSPDGRWLAAGGGNPFSGHESGIVQVFDGETGQARWRNPGLPFPVWSVAFSRDGTRLASCAGAWNSDRGDLKIWDAATGALIRDFAGQADASARAVAFSPDGRRLATACLDHAVRVWDAESGQEIYRVRHGGGVYHVVFSADGRFLVSGGEDGVRFWEAATGKAVRALPQTGSVVALAPDDRLLVTSSSSGPSAKAFEMPESAGAGELPLVGVMAGHIGDVQELAFGPDGLSIASCGSDGTVRIWQTGQQFAEQAVFRGHHGRVAAIAFHPSGRRLASGGQQPGDIKVWDLTRPPDCTVAIDFGLVRQDIEAIAFTKDDRELLVLGLGGVQGRWDTATGQTRHQRDFLTTFDWMVPAVRAAYADQGQQLVAVSQDDPTVIKIWDLATKREVTVLRGHQLKVWLVASQADRVASAGFTTKDGESSREVKVWDKTTGQVLWSETDAGVRPLALCLSPDGALLAEARQRKGQATEVFLTRAGTGERVRLWETAGPVRALSFSADGKLLAAATDPGAILVWEVGTGKPLHDRPLEGPPNLGMLAFSPDGARLAGVNRERLQVWDTLSGQAVLHLRGAGPRSSDNGFNPRLAWSHDGTRLAASNWDRTVTLWDANEKISEQAKRVLHQHAASRAFTWHLDQLDRYQTSAFAARFHRRYLQELGPPSPDQRQRRGDHYARSAQWDRALADFTPPEGETLEGLPQQALLLLKTGDEDGYRKLLSAILKADVLARPVSHWSIVRAGVLAPLPDQETGRLLAVAKQLRAAFPRDRHSLELLGLALLRAGQLPEAGDCLRQLPEPSPRASVALGLYHLRQNELDQAKMWLAKVDAWLGEQAKVTPDITAPVTTDWQYWLEVERLRREADAWLRSR